MKRWFVIALLIAGCGDEPQRADSNPRATATPRATTAAQEPAVTATVGAPQAAVDGSLPGALADGTCAAAGDFWPTMTIAVDDQTAWIACKEDNAVQSLAGAKVALDGAAIAVLSAFDAIWALSDRGTLLRIEDGGTVEQIDLQAGNPYNLWSGAGSLWAIDDGSGEVIRIDPKTNAVVTKIEVGDGPADMVFDGDTAYVVNHRDRSLVAIDTRTNQPRTLATIGRKDVDAPERMALLKGDLWITGRGMDLVQVEPKTGKTLKTVEIGGSGIDVVAAGEALWVPARSEQTDQGGFPTMEALRKVSPSGKVTTVSEPLDRVDVHGLTADAAVVWLADNTAGIVYRVPLKG